MTYVIPGWVHRPGLHCASTAISDAMNFHGLPLSEAMCFGLGSGLGFAYFESELMSPSRMTAVRSRVLESRFFENLGQPFAWQTDPEPDRALARAKEHLRARVPVLIKADIRHLPYYNTQTHFPGHVIAIWGYDDDKGAVLVSDTGWEGLLEVPYPDLNRARYGGVAYMKNTGEHHPFTRPEPITDLRPAINLALRRQAEDLFGLVLKTAGVFGFEGMKKAEETMPGWAQAKDWQWCARWFYQVIERRGTGGGAFRLLYSRFLSEIGELEPGYRDLAPAAVMAEIAAAWTELSQLMKRISEDDEPRGFEPAARDLARVREKEQKFFQRVLDRLDR